MQYAVSTASTASAASTASTASTATTHTNSRVPCAPNPYSLLYHQHHSITATAPMWPRQPQTHHHLPPSMYSYPSHSYTRHCKKHPRHLKYTNHHMCLGSSLPPPFFFPILSRHILIAYERAMYILYRHARSTPACCCCCCRCCRRRRRCCCVGTLCA